MKREFVIRIVQLGVVAGLGALAQQPAQAAPAADCPECTCGQLCDDQAAYCDSVGGTLDGDCYYNFSTETCELNGCWLVN